MDLILFLKHVRDGALRNGIGIEFHSLGAVYQYGLSNKEERDLVTANATGQNFLDPRMPHFKLDTDISGSTHASL